MISWPHLGVGATLTASALLGTSVRGGLVDLGRQRWLHHALYAATLVSSAGSTVTDAAHRRPTWPVAAGTLGVLACLPVTRGGSNSHVLVAGAASAVYLVGTIAVVRRQV